MLKINFKKLHPNAVHPGFANAGDAGMDLTAVSFQQIDREHVKYNFGLALEIPEGYVGLIFPRSSCYKHGQILSNCVGVIDSGYRGEISVIMIGNPLHMYVAGERVAQLVVMPYCNKVLFEPKEELSDSERGMGGFGSTGN